MRYLKSELEVISDIPAFPKVDVETPQTIWLIPDVQQKVYSVISDEDKPLFAFLMLSGCRPGEARALRCKDVNLELGTITISATFSNSVYREKRKGKRTVIPITPHNFDNKITDYH